MHSNVSLVEGLVRLVIAMVFAILAVYSEMFIFMVIAMIFVSTALAQFCPLKSLFKINIHNDKF